MTVININLEKLREIMKKRILAIIPARAGSKGIKNKNIRMINKKPLIYWTINEAKKVSAINKLIVSTDSKKIATIAETYGAAAPFIRPKKFAMDNTLGIKTVLHALHAIDHNNFDYILLLQPTSPLRIAKDINGIINFVIKNNLKSAVSVSSVKDHPELMYELSNSNKLIKSFKNYNSIKIRQRYKKLYRINGALYIAQKKWLIQHKDFLRKETHGYIMPYENSIDVDEIYDLKLAELILKNRKL